MAINKSTVSAADLKNLKDFNKEASNLTTVLKELADALGKNAKEAAKFTGESAAAYETTFTSAVNSAKELAGYTTKQLADKKTEAEFLKKIAKTEQDRARVQAKISELEDKKINATIEEQKYIEKTVKLLNDVDDALEAQLAHADKLKKKYEDISKVDVFAPFKEMMGRIPYLNKALPEMTKASQAFRDSLAEGNSKMKSLGQGAKVLTNGLGQAALGAVLGTAVDEFTKLNERSVNMQHNLGVSRLEALKMNDGMIEASQASGKLWFNSERFQEAQEDINKTLGSNGAISADMAENFAALHHQMGLSTEEATQFNLASINMGKNAKEYTSSISLQTKLLNGQKKLQIDNREILKGVAGTSTRVQLSFKASGQNLAQAVYQAKSLGMNMAQVEKTADSLLDFESSIANELEAELLSGKEYNLEKARAAALTNDMVGLTSELAKQGITAASFGKMNRLEQESTAKMLGMQADELANSLTLQEQLKTVSKESGYRDAKSLEDLQKQVTLRAKKVGMEKALSEIGDKSLRNQIDANTFAEQQALQQTKMAEKVANALGPEGLQKTMDSLDSSIKYLTLAIAALAGLQLGKTITSPLKSAFEYSKGLVKNLGNKSGTAESLTKSATSSASTATKAAGKSGGILGKVGSFFGGIGDKIANSGVGKAVGGALGKMNPIKAAGDVIKGPLKGLGKFLGPIATIISAVGSVSGEIATARAQQAAGQQVNPGDLGKRVVQGAAYPIVNGAMNLIPGFGNAISLVDGLLSTVGMSPLKWVSDNLIDFVPSDMFAGLGNYILKPSGPKKEERKMATGGIVTGPTKALVGEAGPEAVVPLREFYAKIDELIQAVKQGQNIYIGANKLNESIGLNLHSVG
jgi:hypothetical protein